MSDPHLNTLALGMDLTGRTVRNFQGKGFLQSVSPQDFHDLSWLCRNDTPPRREPEFYLPQSSLTATSCSIFALAA